MIWWILSGFFLILVLAFVLIARAGRKLRTDHALPEETLHASLHSADGKKYQLEPEAQFYLGSHPGNQVVLPNSRRDYLVCIFYHRKRFAFQTLSGTPEVAVNGEEQLAGYLFDGDVLTIAGENFTFRNEGEKRDKGDKGDQNV